MEPVSLILAAVVAGAAAGAQSTTSSAVPKAFEGLMALLRRRFAREPSAQNALESCRQAAQDGEAGATAPLEAALVRTGAAGDPDVVAKARELLEASTGRPVHVTGSRTVTIHGSQGVQVGEGGVQNNTFGAPS